MNKLLALLAGLLITSNVLALDSCFTGSWYDPYRNGEGLVIEALDGYTVAYFYTFSEEGQEWYVFQGDDDEALTAYDALKWTDKPWEAVVGKVGYGSITPVDDNHIVFYHNFVLDLEKVENDEPNWVTPWCLSWWCEREYVYNRLTEPVPCD